MDLDEYFSFGAGGPYRRHEVFTDREEYTQLLLDRADALARQRLSADDLQDFARPARNVVVIHGQGGVGKTTMAANLAAALAGSARVLAVDVDPQDSLGRAFGVVAKGRDDSLAALLEDGSADPRGIVRRDVVSGLDLLPAHPSLEAVAVQLAATGGLTTSVRRALRPLLA